MEFVGGGVCHWCGDGLWMLFVGGPCLPLVGDGGGCSQGLYTPWYIPYGMGGFYHPFHGFHMAHF